MSEMLLRTRRAPRACSWCRYRKVRCDASILGCPCTRCRQDGRNNCILRTQFRRGKKPKTSTDHARLHGPDDGERHSNPEALICTDASDKRDDEVVTQKPLEHPFIDSHFLSSLPPEDVAFLSSKGSRALPDGDAIDEFVQQYFKRIHPTVPVVDEAEFWRTYQDHSGLKKVSLFVFQAVLFASCTFVSLETLRRCGFDDKRDARKQLHNRAKLLFDLKAETRPSAKAQGAVLLTHHTSAEEPQAGSLWLMRAIESAMLIDAQPSLLVENVTQSLKKRLWWSILLRDRSLCIGLRRRPQVPMEQCDWMAEEDFEDEIQHSRVYDETTKRELFHALQEQCRLAVVLSDLVSLIFVPRSTPSCILSVTEFHGLMSTIGRIKWSLVEWETQSPLSPPMSTGTTDVDDPANILSNLTFMYLHAARVDLAQYAAFMIEENLAFSKDTYHRWKLEIGHDLKHGIEGLSSAMEYFSIQGHLESLPLSVLGYVGMPLILAAVNLKLSSSYEEMTARKRRLDSLSRIIRHSYTLYDVTDYVAVGINHILQLAYLTTKNIFLQCRRPSEGQAIESSHSGHRMSLRTHIQEKSTPVGRATSWLDAFIMWPRAYLLISTSVDYSLAVGRLPYDNALPEMVRHIPAMGAIFTLPWTINVHPVGKRMERPRRCSSSQAVARPTSTDSNERAHHWQYGANIMRASNGAIQDYDNPALDDDPEAEGPSDQQFNGDNGDNGTIINLNYMDLGGAPNSCASSSPAGTNNAGELSIPKDRNSGLEQADHCDSVTAGTTFDSALLDGLTHELWGEGWDDV